MADGRSSPAVKIVSAIPRAYEALLSGGGMLAIARELLESLRAGRLPIASPQISNVASTIATIPARIALGSLIHA